VRPTPKGERFTIRGLRVPGAEGGWVGGNLEAGDCVFQDNVHARPEWREEKAREKAEIKAIV